MLPVGEDPACGLYAPANIRLQLVRIRNDNFQPATILEEMDQLLEALVKMVGGVIIGVPQSLDPFELCGEF